MNFLILTEPDIFLYWWCLGMEGHFWIFFCLTIKNWFQCHIYFDLWDWLLRLDIFWHGEWMSFEFDIEISFFFSKNKIGTYTHFMIMSSTWFLYFRSLPKCISSFTQLIKTSRNSIRVCPEVFKWSWLRPLFQIGKKPISRRKTSRNIEFLNISTSFH